MPFIQGGGGSGGGTLSIVGYNTVGGSSEAIANNALYKKITLASNSLMLGIGASIAGNNGSQGFSVAVMSDNAGAPQNVLAINGTSNTTAFTKTNATRRWIDIPVGIYLVAGTYWIVFASTINTAVTSIAFDGSGGDARATNQAEIDDGSVTTPTVGTNKYSIRATILSPL